MHRITRPFVTTSIKIAVLTAIVLGTIAGFGHRDTSAAGPFIASGLYTATFTASYPPPLNPVHSFCTFRVDTDTVPNPDVLNMRAVCYTVAKTDVPNSYPPAPPPPPPPYTPLVPPVGLDVLSGDINAGTGAVTLLFSPNLCLPVDNLPNDGTPDGGIQASLTTSISKAGVLQPGTVQLQTDRTPPGGPWTCNDFNAPDTITGPMTPASRADGDDDGDGCLTSAELGPTAGLGGLRDPSNPFDYADINHDGAISVPVDIVGVAGAFGLPGPGNPRYIDYKDRGPSLGLNSWNQRPPDGAIGVGNDILGAASQFGHSCTHSHPAAGTAPPLTRYGGHPTNLTASIAMGTLAPMAISVSNTAAFPSPTGQVLIDGELMSYDQTGGACGAIAANTQFCIVTRGTPAAHANGAIVFHAQTALTSALAAGTGVNFKVDVGTTAGFQSAGYLRVDGEVMRYDQSVVAGGCAGLSTATQFCIIERQCDNFTIDDDSDGWVNDGCPQVGATSEDQGQCAGNTNNDPGDDGDVNDGCPQLGAAPESGANCSNNTDEDGDGRVNDGCPVSGSDPENPDCSSNVNDDPGDDSRVNDGCPQANTASEAGTAHAIGARVLPQ